MDINEKRKRLARRKESGGTKSKYSKKRTRIRVVLRMPMMTRSGRNIFDSECGETGVKNGCKRG